MTDFPEPSQDETEGLNDARTDDVFAVSADGVPSYLNRLTKAPLLSADEEVRLTRLVQQGDARAKTRLVESNMRLVINIAKTYRNRAIPLEDLIQEGAIGLMQAAERFDPERGFRFSTYATHWIRQAIGRAIDNKSKSIRLPAHISQSLRRIEKERARLQRELGCEPTPDQISVALDIPPQKLIALLQSSQELLSLDMRVGDSGAMTLGGLIKDPSTSDPEQHVIAQELLETLNGLLGQLSERERRFVRMKFHDADEEELDPEDPDQQLTRDRVRKLENQALKKLKALAQQHRLRDMMGD